MRAPGAKPSSAWTQARGCLARSPNVEKPPRKAGPGRCGRGFGLAVAVGAGVGRAGHPEAVLGGLEQGLHLGRRGLAGVHEAAGGHALLGQQRAGLGQRGLLDLGDVRVGVQRQVDDLVRAGRRDRPDGDLRAAAGPGQAGPDDDPAACAADGHDERPAAAADLDDAHRPAPAGAAHQAGPPGGRARAVTGRRPGWAARSRAASQQPGRRQPSRQPSRQRGRQPGQRWPPSRRRPGSGRRWPGPVWPAPAGAAPARRAFRRWSGVASGGAHRLARCCWRGARGTGRPAGR